MTKLLKIVGFSIFIIIMFSVAFAQEQITVTTYYPSPYGSYRELRTNKMAVSPTRTMPADGNLAWGNNRGLLSPDQGASIELGGTGTPHIDFYNDMTSTRFDASISLHNDNTLRMYVGRGPINEVEVRNQPNSDWADIEVKDIYLCHQ